MHLSLLRALLMNPQGDTQASPKLEIVYQTSLHKLWHFSKPIAFRVSQRRARSRPRLFLSTSGNPGSRHSLGMLHSARTSHQ